MATSYTACSLTFLQFASFCQWVWNTRLEWTEKNFWVQIAQVETLRRFSESGDYCDSQLSFSPKKGWAWQYETTSGTILKASQEVFGYGSNLPEIQCEVQIPDRRIGGNHSAFLRVALADLPYMSWGEYHKEDTPLKIQIVNTLHNSTHKERAEEALREAEKVEQEPPSDNKEEDYEGMEEDYYDEFG